MGWNTHRISIILPDWIKSIKIILKKSGLSFMGLGSKKVINKTVHNYYLGYNDYNIGNCKFI